MIIDELKKLTSVNRTTTITYKNFEIVMGLITGAEAAMIRHHFREFEESIPANEYNTET